MDGKGPSGVKARTSSSTTVHVQVSCEWCVGIMRAYVRPLSQHLSYYLHWYMLFDFGTTHTHTHTHISTSAHTHKQKPPKPTHTHTHTQTDHRLTSSISALKDIKTAHWKVRSQALRYIRNHLFTSAVPRTQQLCVLEHVMLMSYLCNQVLCVCVCGGDGMGAGEKQRERERERLRVR